MNPNGEKYKGHYPSRRKGIYYLMEKALKEEGEKFNYLHLDGALRGIREIHMYCDMCQTCNECKIREYIKCNGRDTISAQGYETRIGTCENPFLWGNVPPSLKGESPFYKERNKNEGLGIQP